MVRESEELLWVAAAWIAFAVGASFLLRSRIGKIVLVTLAVGVPFWELPFGYLHFRDLCDKYAKPRVFHALPAQHSVCLQNFSPSRLERLVGVGFLHVEVQGPVTNAQDYKKNGRYRNNLLLVDGGNVKSEYCIVSRVNEVESWDISRSDYLIVRAQSREEVARESAYFWQGLWWQRAAHPVLGNGGHCFPAEGKLFALLRSGSD